MNLIILLKTCLVFLSFVMLYQKMDGSNNCSLKTVTQFKTLGAICTQIKINRYLYLELRFQCSSFKTMDFSFHTSRHNCFFIIPLSLINSCHILFLWIHVIVSLLVFSLINRHHILFLWVHVIVPLPTFSTLTTSPPFDSPQTSMCYDIAPLGDIQ